MGSSIINHLDVVFQYVALTVAVSAAQKKTNPNIFTYYYYAIGTKHASGFGSTKRQAKHNAAKELIELITGTPFHNTLTLMTTPASSSVTLSTGSSAQSSPNSSSSSSSSSMSNGSVADDLSVNRLQEYVIGNRLPAPKYINERFSGPDNRRTFEITCVVDRFQSSGAGNTKKAAKKDAAHKVLLLILGKWLSSLCFHSSFFQTVNNYFRPSRKSLSTVWLNDEQKKNKSPLRTKLIDFIVNSKGIDDKIF